MKKYIYISKIIALTLFSGMILYSCKPQSKKVTSLDTNKNPDKSTIQMVSNVKHPEWSKNLSIYEVNLRQYTKSGTFRDFEEHLPRLKKLGVGILWLMPIHPIGEKNRKGSLGSYYSIKDYYGVNPEFGTIEDFKHLVTKIHDLGMYVIIDWVANHTAWDNLMIREHPEWYTVDIDGNFRSPVDDWSDVVDLNFNNNKLQSYMMDAMKFWVQTTDIDGFRCDVAGMVPTEFWDKVRVQLDSFKLVFLLAEWEDPLLHENAFDMTYAWEIHRTFNKLAKGEQYLQSLDVIIENDQKDYPENTYRMLFTTNHDENTWNGTAIDRFGDGLDVFTVLTYTLPGMPLIYSGQEAGLSKQLAFFDKDDILWQQHPAADQYRELNQLKYNNPALWNGEFGGAYTRVINSMDNVVLSFFRKKDKDTILVMANLSPNPVNFNMKLFFPNGEFTDIDSGEKVTFNKIDQFQLPPWGYRIFEYLD